MGSDKIITFRDIPIKQDESAIREIVTSTGFFNEEEIEIAVELATERLEKGVESGYHFLFIEIDGQTVGYSCFGPIPATANSYDLYWIAVHQKYRSAGIGKLLLEKSEQAIKKLGGSRIYIETSSRDQYIPTRAFYTKCDYQTAAILEDFYATGDSKYIFVKVV